MLLKVVFISNVSHELRTPLFNIKSYVETLHDLNDKLTEEEKIEFLGIANSETDRLTRLVNDVLDLSKLETSPKVKFEKLNIDPGIEQTLRNYKLNAEDKKVDLCHEIEENLPSILGNWDMLLQVLDNLVGNALKFSRRSGKLMIRAYTWPDICITSFKNKSNDAPCCDVISPLPRVRVEISDTGCGISREDQLKIFERFYRVENSVHTEAGTGLGLSIVKGILGKHGSQIRMASEPEIGTTFWFDLPLSESDEDELLIESEKKAREWEKSLEEELN